MVHNWGEKGTGRVWGLIKYAKKLLNYVFPRETSGYAALLKMYCVDLEERICSGYGMVVSG